jgi:single-strand DNA-binding protein
MNQVVLIGRLVRDPEMRIIPSSGRPVTNFTLAIDKNLSREKKQELQAKGIPTADFIRVVVWGKMAETCANYLSKGRQVAVNGSIQTGSYKGQDGQTRYTTDVLANNVEFLGSKDSQGDSSKSDESGFGYDPGEFKAVDEDDNIPF